MKLNSPLATARLKDKLKGMLLLGGYGDALGAPHESLGNQGEAGDPASSSRLSPFRDYGHESAHPWGVWSAPASIDGDKLGMPTDDTSFRVAILHRWLSQLTQVDEIPTEESFRNWLQAEEEPTANAPQWQKSRHAQIRDWIAMFNDALRLSNAPDDFSPSDDNPFFRKDVPVVFGLFMYLELAAVYVSCPLQDVFTEFSSFTSLDQSYGKFVTGMMAAMLVHALDVSPQSKPLDQWFFETAGFILDSDFGDAEHRLIVKTHFDAAKQIGSDNQDLSEAEFMGQLKEVFDQELPPPSSATRSRFRSFDPLLFLKMMAAVVAYSEGEVMKTLRVLSVSPGDCDTMASQLGSLIGAWCGEEALREIESGFAADLDRVEDCIKDQFDIEIYDLADCLIELADKHGCFQQHEAGQQA